MNVLCEYVPLFPPPLTPFHIHTHMHIKPPLSHMHICTHITCIHTPLTHITLHSLTHSTHLHTHMHTLSHHTLTHTYTHITLHSLTHSDIGTCAHHTSTFVVRCLSQVFFCEETAISRCFHSKKHFQRVNIPISHHFD